MCCLYQEFVLDNVCAYTSIYGILLTSSAFMKRWRRCYVSRKMHILSFSVQPTISTSTWSRFTDYVMRKDLFWAPSSHRMQLCVLLDFIASCASPSFFFFATMADPIRSLVLKTGIVDYVRGAGCDYPFSFSTSFAQQYLAHLPMRFVLRCADTQMRGIVYTEAQYYMHQGDEYYECATNLCEDFFGDGFDGMYREESHVVQMLDRIYIIILLFDYGENDAIKRRCVLQNTGANRVAKRVGIADKSTDILWKKRLYRKMNNSVL